MRMRKRFAGAATVVAAAGFVAAASLPAHATETIKLTFISGYPPASSLIAGYIDGFAPAVDAQLAKTGNYKIDWNMAHSGQIVKVKGELEGVELGLGDMAMVGTVFYPAQLPLYDLTYKTPFTSTNMDLMARTFRKIELKYADVFDKSWDKYNQIQLYPSGALDNYEIMSSKPVSKFEDLKGMKIGAVGPNLLWVIASGAAGVNSSLPSAYHSLSTGVFEAYVGWNQAAGAFKLCEPAPYILDPAFGPALAAALTVNADFYEGLPEEVQKAIKDHGVTWHESGNATMLAGSTTGLAFCKKEHGTTVTKLSEADRNKWAFAMPNFAQEWAEATEATGVPAKAILAEYMDAMRAAGEKPVRNWDKE